MLDALISMFLPVIVVLGLLAIVGGFLARAH